MKDDDYFFNTSKNIDSDLSYCYYTFLDEDIPSGNNNTQYIGTTTTTTTTPSARTRVVNYEDLNNSKKKKKTESSSWVRKVWRKDSNKTVGIPVVVTSLFHGITLKRAQKLADIESNKNILRLGGIGHLQSNNYRNGKKFYYQQHTLLNFEQRYQLEQSRLQQRREDDNIDNNNKNNNENNNNNNNLSLNYHCNNKSSFITSITAVNPINSNNNNNNNSNNNKICSQNHHHQQQQQQAYHSKNIRVDEYLRIEEKSKLHFPWLKNKKKSSSIGGDTYQTMTSVQHPGWASPNAPQQQQQQHHAISSGMPVASVQNPATAVGTAVGPGGGDSYFTESRKGEVNELRNLLRNFTIERDPKRKRDVIKKVIAYMTLGIDVSRLFTEMMLAIETRDLVVKKMVYLFLCNYATANPDLAQMCTNTLQKDCGNEDPMVRGLALRALCSLRLPQMVEYISEPVRRGLNDGHSYVRKTAVMGLLKLYHLDGELFEREKFVDQLYDMLRDPDAAVVTNCILVLNEVMANGPNGGMAINRAIILHLLNRCHEFDEFGIVAVLELVPKYIPANDDEGFQIMNLLDPVLRTSNAGAFVAVIRAFLSIANTNAEMQRQVVSRAKAPLVTMMSGGSHELAFTILKHIDALVQLCPNIFDDEYRQFYVRYSDPTHVKYLKMEILPRLVNPNNAPDIVAELSEIAFDTDSTLGSLAVRSLAYIACRDSGGEGCAHSIARRLVDMLDMGISHVSSEAATALQNMLRKHASLKGIISPPLPRALKYVSQPTGKASIIYLIGECGEVLQEAPYSLEKLIDSYPTIDNYNVKIALLSSTMKLFFLRPPEVHKMLGRLLKYATEDVSCQDLHDRALWYYRLLRTSAADPSLIQTIVQTNTSIGDFAEENMDDDIRQDLMQEFNTLSIIYGSTSENFIAEEFQVKFVKQPKEHPLTDSAPPAQDLSVNVINDQLEQTTIQDTTITDPPPQPAATTVSSTEVDLLGFVSGGVEEPAVNSSNTLTLSPSVTMSGDEYQSQWGAIADSQALVTQIPFRVKPTSTEDIETPLAKSNIMTMASGILPDQQFKFFLYAQESTTQAIILIQASIVTQGNIQMNLTLKSKSGDVPQMKQLSNTIQSALSSFA